MSENEVGIGSRVRHPQFGEGIITGVKQTTYSISFKERGRLEIAKAYADLEILEAVSMDEDMVSFSEVEHSLIKILRRWAETHEIVNLGTKWLGGKLVLQPANDTLKPKEMPIETFFHKIVMIRDRLRVLEQNINSHKVLTDEDKVHLQQYITRIYGSLTSFNILFDDRDDYFTGESSRKDD